MPKHTNKRNTESRRFKRYEFTVPVRVTIAAPQATLLETRADHMNDGGIAMRTNAKLSIGTQAKIEFAPASFDFPLTLSGVVRNRAGKEYGVEFLATSPAENEHLTIFREILHSKAGCSKA